MGNIKDLRKLVNFCKKNGIIHYKSDNIEFSLSERSLQFPKSRRIKEVEIPIAGLPPQETQPMNAMDLLLWSATPQGINSNGEN